MGYSFYPTDELHSGGTAEKRGINRVLRSFEWCKYSSLKDGKIQDQKRRTRGKNCLFELVTGTIPGKSGFWRRWLQVLRHVNTSRIWLRFSDYLDIN